MRLNKQQQLRLEKIIASLEAFQHVITDEKAKERISKAKTELLRVEYD